MVVQLRRIVAGWAMMLALRAGSAFADNPVPPSAAASAETGGTISSPGETSGASPATESRGEDDEDAKRAFEGGLESLRAGQWRDAETKFRQSLGLVKRASTMYDLAFVLYMQGRPRECLALLEELRHATDTASDPRYEHYAALLMPRVLSEMSTLRLLVNPPTAHVRIDGERATESGSERSLRVLPGGHDVEVSAPGYATKSLALVTRAGTELEREVALDGLGSVAVGTPAERRRSAAPPSFVSAVLPWIVLGVGGALLVGGAATGILAKDADDDLHAKCPTNKGCDPALKSARDRVVALGGASDILLVSGGVLAAGGLTWRLLAPASPKSSGEHAVLVTLSGTY